MIIERSNFYGIVSRWYYATLIVICLLALTLSSKKRVNT